MGSVLGPSPFSIFIKDLEEVAEYTLVKFGGATKLGRPVNILGGSITIQGHLGWRNHPTRTSWIQQMLNAKSCTWAGPNPALVQAGDSLSRV